MAEECLICKAPLEYLTQDEMMECAVCHKTEASKTRCVNGHFVCSDCHTEGMDSIFGLCLSETSKDPIEILEKMEYISSSGLRIILTAHKKVTAKGGKFIVRNLTREVSSVIDLTGFSRILTIE